MSFWSCKQFLFLPTNLFVAIQYVFKLFLTIKSRILINMNITRLIVATIRSNQNLRKTALMKRTKTFRPCRDFPSQNITRNVTLCCEGSKAFRSNRSYFENSSFLKGQCLFIVSRRMLWCLNEAGALCQWICNWVHVILRLITVKVTLSARHLPGRTGISKQVGGLLLFF